MSMPHDEACAVRSGVLESPARGGLAGESERGVTRGAIAPTAHSLLRNDSGVTYATQGSTHYSFMRLPQSDWRIASLRVAVFVREL